MMKTGFAAFLHLIKETHAVLSIISTAAIAKRLIAYDVYK